MQGGQGREPRDEVTAVAAAQFLEPGSAFAFLAEHRTRLFPPALFSELFPSGRGRPSIDPTVAAAVMVLQALYGLSDRQTVHALAFDLRWKLACGYPVETPSFHPSTLTYWRRRIASSGAPRLILEAVREALSQSAGAG